MKKIPGINIQWPWTEYILSGKKTIETRNYPIPLKHLGHPLALVETPGKLKKGEKAKIVGIAVFGSNILYQTKSQWKRDRSKHLVDDGDALFSFQEKRLKYGWPVEKVIRVVPSQNLPKTRGIVFANGCEVPVSAYMKIVKS